MQNDLLIGCDPELFVKNKGEFISAHGLIQGNKANPYYVDDGMVQVDGMALEFGITPAATSGQFIKRIDIVLKQLKEMIPSSLKLEMSPVAFFSDKVMEEAPREAKELGCTPDFNAWSGGMNSPPEAPSNMRSAGGHVHLGWTNDKDPFDPDHFYSCCTLVKMLDYYLGVPSLLLDSDTERRKIYGKAGSFRAKPYGLEYRSLSNFWIKEPKLMRWVFDRTQESFTLLSKKGVRLEKEYGNLAQKIIDNNDTAGAKKLVDKLGVKMP